MKGISGSRQRTYFGCIVQAAPDIVPDGTRGLGKLEYPDSRIDLFLLADGEPVRVHPCSVDATQSFDDGLQVIECACRDRSDKAFVNRRQVEAYL